VAGCNRSRLNTSSTSGTAPGLGSHDNADLAEAERDLEEKGNIDPGLTLYGLRHTVAVVLRELG